jgi:hypothetical protein
VSPTMMCAPPAVEHSELWRMGPDGQPQDRLRARGEVTPGTLMASQRGNKGGGNLLLVLDEGAKHGAPKVTDVLG